MKKKYIETYGNAYELPSPNSKELIDLLRTFCKENGMMYKPQECFDYMMELPDKYPQMSIFDL